MKIHKIYILVIVGDKYVFEMRSPPRAAYIATGLSADVSGIKQYM